MPRFAPFVLVVLLWPASITADEPRPDMLLADFEGETYGGWKTEGEAFGSGPARGTLPNQMPVSGFLGKGLVNSFAGGDRTTGTLTSPPFRIERRYLNFLIGGGDHPGETCINLLIDGKVVRTATGPNDRPGGSEQLDWHSWDVAEFAGKSATIQIVDHHTGGWGHINVDQILQSDRKRQAAPAERELVIAKHYLHLPVTTGAPKQRMKFLLEGRTVREFEIELADREPQFHVFSEVSAFTGKALTISVDRLPEGSRALQAITQSDELPDAETLYREKHRPQFHFTARRGWLNDPNGLVHHQGEWHLYFQHNPYGRNWGNMHWGHAVSRDLVHWEELPIALYPQRFGDWCFSGSAVVDAGNTAGFQQGAEPPLVIAYTSTGRGECIAYSTDRGRTFTEYDGNPVVKHRGRDPRLVWYEPGQHWVMAVYDEHDSKQWIAFYTSPNLKDWTFQSRIEGYYECPELFELPVEGDSQSKKWVVYAADGAYAVGSFDGKTFTPDTDKQRFNWGNCFYASQTYSNVPPDDGRRIQIAWGRVEIPKMPFNQMMNFPVELTLRNTEEGLRLFAHPVRELERLHRNRHTVKAQTLNANQNPLTGIDGELFHIRAIFAVDQGSKFALQVRGVPIEYDARTGTLTCQGQTAPLRPDRGKITLEILVDRASLEIFANDGRYYIPLGIVFDPRERSLAVSSRGGTTRIDALEVFELQSAWETSSSGSDSPKSDEK